MHPESRERFSHQVDTKRFKSLDFKLMKVGPFIPPFDVKHLLLEASEVFPQVILLSDGV